MFIRTILKCYIAHVNKVQNCLRIVETCLPLVHNVGCQFKIKMLFVELNVYILCEMCSYEILICLVYQIFVLPRSSFTVHLGKCNLLNIDIFNE